MYAKEEIIDYAANSEEIEKWLALKGETKYMRFADILKNNGIDVEWNVLKDIYRYDKRLLVNIFKYISVFEEFLRAQVWNVSQTGYKKLEGKSLGEVIEAVIEFKDSVQYGGFSADTLTRNKEFINYLRNRVSHNKIMLESNKDGKKLKDLLIAFKETLPEGYRQGFAYDINKCSLGLELSETIIIRLQDNKKIMKKSNIFSINTFGTISSVDELIEQLTSRQATIIDSNVQLFYRGEARNFETKLLPTIFREGYKEESFYYYDALTNFPQEFENLSSLSRLAKMQHYWCPTRLLDLTNNPLVALYFACCENLGETGYFYIFKTAEVLNYDSDRALLLSCLSHLNKVQQNSLQKFILNFIKEKGFNRDDCRINKEYINRKKNHMKMSDEDGVFQFERLIGEVVRERISFLEYNTVAQDLLTPRFVRPLIQNERQKKQDGYFLIMGLMGECESVHNCEKIAVDCFKVKNKKKILEELDLLGINKATLFGDLENRVKYLNSREK